MTPSPPPPRRPRAHFAPRSVLGVNRLFAKAGASSHDGGAGGGGAGDAQRNPRVKPIPIKKQNSGYKPYRMRTFWLVPVVMLVAFGAVFGFFAREEVKTSKLQASYFSEVASEVKFGLHEGENPIFHVPSKGPYNQRLGYSYLPFFIKALSGNGYKVTEQAQTSQRYQFLISKGIYPIYHPKTVAGMRLLAHDDQPLYNVNFPSNVFSDFESTPKLLVDTLLFIENRELLSDGPVTRNPAIEWDRFFFAALGQVVKIFAPNFNLGGGSTLATQIEKFRFSPGGQTHGAMDKLRQIASASLRVYQDGMDTRLVRRKIVLDYLNSTPLSARAGFGEINSIGDGMWAWFGRDIPELTLMLNLPETDADSLRAKSICYRETVGLILAQRRPTAYLLTNRASLDDLTDATLDRLMDYGVISRTLRDAARKARFRFLPEPPKPPQVPFLEQKAVTAMRTHLLSMLRLKNLYELDRIDLTATSTLNKDVQQKVVEFLKQMGSPEFLQSIGLYGFRLLKPENDPSKIHWSVVLYERGDDGNRLRIQADNIDAPFDMNEGVKLDLGSTAKLRTLVTYLEIIGELHRRYAGLSVEDLRDLAQEAPDVLTSWVTTWLAANPAATLDQMLDAAMARKYSANPGEVFFTGGGAHTFVNFDKIEDHKIMDMHEAMRDSVNLVFIRLMRDIVNYTVGQGQQTRQELMSDPDHPARRDYLERYADKEGMTFLNRYISHYRDLSPDEMLEKATLHGRKGATARTILFRSMRPKASYDEYVAYMRAHTSPDFDSERLPKLYREYPADRYNLADRGYITGINPLELWLVSYLQSNPKATRAEILAVSKPIRIDSYAWLFRRSLKGAQDTRIRILLELDAFARIQQRWARLGYPFEKLIPSFATSIGSSADKPGALAELVGILLNDGVRKPTLRFEKFNFAKDTPFETTMEPSGSKGVQVLDPAIARVVRGAMMEVVENGTAKRLRGSYVDQDGNPLAIGGKTGTGDHRYDEFGAGGRLISSRVVNRTGTIAFFIGDKFFGTVTAHVAGEQAGDYKFTSALSAQVLKSLAVAINPLIAPPRPQPSPVPTDTASPSSVASPEAVATPQPSVTPSPKPSPTKKPKPRKVQPVDDGVEANEGGWGEAIRSGAVPDSSALQKDILEGGDLPASE